jgi:hypothetical protein
MPRRPCTIRRKNLGLTTAMIYSCCCRSLARPSGSPTQDKDANVQNNNKAGLLGLMLGQTWAQRLATLLDWSPVDKGLIPLAMVILVYAQYWCWGLYALSRPDHARLVDPTYMNILLTLNPSLLA